MNIRCNVKTWCFFLDAFKGRLVESKGFDTHGYSSSVTSMKNYLRNLPDGYVHNNIIIVLNYSKSIVQIIEVEMYKHYVLRSRRRAGRTETVLVFWGSPTNFNFVTPNHTHTYTRLMNV